MSIILLIYVVIIWLLFFSETLKGAKLIALIYSLVGLLLILILRTEALGGDLTSYYIWFENVSKAGSLNDLLELSNDIGFTMLMVIPSMLSSTPLMFDIFQFFVIGTMLLFTLFLECKKAGSIKTALETIAVFIAIYIFSRLFIDYSSNGLRSTITAIIIFNFIVFYSIIGFKTKVILVLAMFLVHIKITIMFLVVLLVAPLCSLRFSKLIFLLSVPIILGKILGLIQFGSSSALPLLALLSDTQSSLLRTEHFFKSELLGVSIGAQVLVYICLPVYYLVFLSNKKLGKVISAIVSISIFTYAILMPAIPVAERFLYYTFPITTYMFCSAFKTEKNLFSILIMCALVLMNFISLYSVLFSDGFIKLF